MKIPKQYHSSLKNFLAVFGYQFSNITVQRFDKNNNVNKLIEVPIEYSQKAKWLRILESDNKGSRIAFTLPRLSFEIVGISYVPEEALNQNHYINCVNSNGYTTSISQPVTYNVDLVLNIVTKLQDDGMQILEQILPRFSPNETWEYLSVPEMNISNTVPVVLNTATPALQLDPDLKTSEIFVWMLSFSAKVKFYGRIYDDAKDANNQVILKVNIKDALSRFSYQLDGDLSTGEIKETITDKPHKNKINIHLMEKGKTDV